MRCVEEGGEKKKVRGTRPCKCKDYQALCHLNRDGVKDGRGVFKEVEDAQSKRS
jgi:hypothetical protein